MISRHRFPNRKRRSPSCRDPRRRRRRTCRTRRSRSRSRSRSQPHPTPRPNLQIPIRNPPHPFPNRFPTRQRTHPPQRPSRRCSSNPSSLNAQRFPLPQHLRRFLPLSSTSPLSSSSTPTHFPSTSASPTSHSSSHRSDGRRRSSFSFHIIHLHRTPNLHEFSIVFSSSSRTREESST